MVNKEWIQHTADELANSRYSKDFYDLPIKIQTEVYQYALAEYSDHCAQQMDSMYERIRDLGIDNS